MWEVLWRGGVFLVITAIVYAICSFVLIPMEERREARRTRR